MRAPRKIKHEFVEYIPKEKSEGVIYISIPHATAVHNCFCGCGLKVVTPFSPVGWQLIYDGETVSLFPSIGNWNFPCRSHYWVRQDTAIPAPNMKTDEIARNRTRDRESREVHFGRQSNEPPAFAQQDRLLRWIKDDDK